MIKIYVPRFLPSKFFFQIIILFVVECGPGVLLFVTFLSNLRFAPNDMAQAIFEPTLHLKTLCKKTGTSYNKKDVLGMGSYGIVFRGFHRDREVAVKRIELHRLNPEDREVKMQMKLEHENVLKILTVEKDDDFRYIVLELCAGTLDQICEKSKVYSGPVLPSDQTVLYQITDGLHHIHSHKLVHGDVKPENILISMTGQIKLSEFGLCRQITSQATMESFSSSFKGPAMWMAPELLQQPANKPDSPIPVKATAQSDIFSAGCVFFVFVTRGNVNHPFGDDHTEVQNNIRNNQLVNIDKLNSGHFATLIIKNMIEPEPLQRIPLTEVKQILHQIIPRPSLVSSSSVDEVLEHSPFPGSNDETTSPPKARRRWKSLQSERRKYLAQQFKEIQMGSSPTSDTTQFNLTPPKGASIGVRLENCPRSSKYENIPKIVEQCVEIVETHGMENVGVYRVPGNFAVINALTESFNRGDFSQSDMRWNDVNAISSVMKSFFRQLPDPLMTSELYGAVIEASKMEPEEIRLNLIKRLVNELPDPHYSTLRYLVGHLSRVAGKSDVNKMNARNLATVFGPTLIRSGDDSMATMVSDMPHQCRIVETLIDNIDFIFPSTDHNQVYTADAQPVASPN